jgi:hypothetical protein
MSNATVLGTCFAMLVFWNACAGAIAADNAIAVTTTGFSILDIFVAMTPVLNALANPAVAGISALVNTFILIIATRAIVSTS